MSACAARGVTLPTDPGVPFNDFAQVHEQLTEACRGVRTLTAELALAGRAARAVLRGRVVAGFERPASMRLEGVAPFGPPAFILAARGNTAVLLLPRDDRVLKGERAEDMLGALTGVALAPADLQAILTGCVTSIPSRRQAGCTRTGGRPSISRVARACSCSGRTTPGSSAPPVARGGRSTTRRGRVASRRPSACSPTDQRSNVDLTATLSQVESNVDLDPAAFTVDVPPDRRRR